MDALGERSRGGAGAAGAGMAVILALVVAATDLQLGASDADTVTKSGDAREGLVALGGQASARGRCCARDPIDGETDPDQSPPHFATWTASTARSPGQPQWQRGGTALVEAIPIPDSGSDEGGDARRRAISRSRDRSGRAGRRPACVQRGLHRRRVRHFPLMIALITVTTFILLARAFRSLLLPAKAIILNILSVAAARGVLVLVWQHGYGSELIWGVQATGSIPSWMPLMIFAFLFGLSMDYEVFILARMREEYDRTGSTERAVVEGIGRTGRLVTSAALILFLSFVAMASSPGTDLKMFATGLGAGILLDATIIRALIVPAVILLMGRWNWWLPKWPARLLRVEPSVLRRPATGEAEA